MTQRNQVYKCDICGNIVDVKHVAAGELVCCGKAMNLLKANTQDAAVEKHVPFVNRDGEKVKVQIGEVIHPMDEDHYIDWISIVSKNKTQTAYLEIGNLPEAVFIVNEDEEIIIYAYCNLHGLWKKEI